MGLKDKFQQAQANAAERAEQIKAKQAEAQAKRSEAAAAKTGADTSGAIFVGQSHEDGRNSVVTLYPDRLERVKARSMMSASKAAQDAEVTPVRAISSVQAKKDGMLYTKVTVFASGNNIDFRFGHDEAAKFKTVLTNLLLQGSASTAPTAAPVDVADQLSKLAALREQGVLTEEEFNSQKAKLLGL